VNHEVAAHLELPYGKGKLSFDLPRGWMADIFRPNSISAAKNPRQEISRSFEYPLGDGCLENFRGVKSVAIAIPDETRLISYSLILPLLFGRLNRMGIASSSIRLLIASGLHPPMDQTRLSTILPSEILKEYSVVVHDARRADLKFLGNTSRGTPVFLNPLFLQADLRLVIGLIDPHQFVGYTGGVKGAAIGLAGAQTIEANHSMLFDPCALVGEIQDNPVRQDIEEIGHMIGVHWVFNVVLDETNGIVKTFSGNPAEVERIGSEFCRTLYETKAIREYDWVIASPGGYPKDINVYQAQKALAHVTPLVRPGGNILFLAECPDGHGDESFYQMMIKYKNPREVIDHFKQAKFKMGDHKAFLWCRSLVKARVHLHSAIDERLCRTLMVSSVKTIQDTFEKIRTKYPDPKRVAVIPKANSTYFRIRN
jgi:lactate racemase